ncbi:MAG: rane protein, partial [Paenibacillus sp.]|nr:rane protein [Paenibacillus sp.]
RTRYPVCDPDKDNIIGFIHIKDLLKSRDGLDNIRSIVRPMMSIPESMPISTLLKMMQKKRTEVALLIDEYGGTSGLVTMEDILEELVGEIHDEFDEERPTIEKKDEHTHSVDGMLHIEEFNDYFGLDIETDDYDTIGGWVYSQVEIPPKKLQRVQFRNYEMVVEEVDHMRVSRLAVRKLTSEEENEVVSVVS